MYEYFETCSLIVNKFIFYSIRKTEKGEIRKGKGHPQKGITYFILFCVSFLKSMKILTKILAYLEIHDYFSNLWSF